jgi:hypothetical protein
LDKFNDELRGIKILLLEGKKGKSEEGNGRRYTSIVRCAVY